MSRTLYLALAMDLKGFGPKLKDAERDLVGFGDHIGRLGTTMSSMLGPALLGAGIAAGALAAKLGIDGVKGAIEDEAAVAKLAKTMENLGLAQDTKAAEASIDAMQRQYGIADLVLRPGLDRLIRSIGDTEDATAALDLATQIATVTGKSLDSVVQALAKGYDGNTQGLMRLGAGIDSATLKTGDMAVITAKLSETFAGQAKTASETYEGQLKRLAVGFDELKEAFGQGFLSGLGNANDTTSDFMQTMKDLEPELKTIGESLGDLTVDTVKGTAETLNFLQQLQQTGEYWDRTGTLALLKFSNAMGGLTDEQIATAEANYQLWLQNNNLIGQMDPLARSIYVTSTRWQQYADSILAARAASSNFALTTGELRQAISPTVAAAIAGGQATALYGGKLIDYGVAVEAATTSTGGMTKETGILTTAFDLQRGVVEELQGKLDDQVKGLDRATSAAKEYSTTLASQLLGGIDLGAAQEQGAELGISSLDAFDRQIDQHEWFGNVLTAIRSSGADQRLIDQIASLGPAAGGKLGQEMLDNGLVGAFNQRLEGVVALAKTTATAMAGEFFPAGTEAAIGMVDATITQMGAETKRLKEIGKNMGDLIGAKMAAEIADAVAKAVAAAEAVKTAAAAERAAQVAARGVVVSEQNIAQALARLIAASNARAGYSMGVPVPTPVI